MIMFIIKRFINSLRGERSGANRQMVVIIRTIILILFLVMAGCAPTTAPVQIIGQVSEKPVPPAFMDAENAFGRGAYTEAMAGYNTFLRHAEDDHFMDAALFKIGKIYRFTDHDLDAIAIFSRLEREFPQSKLAPEAMLEILHILFDRGDFRSLIIHGLTFVETTDATLQKTQFYLVIADAYEQLGAHPDAARFYCWAWSSASGKVAETIWIKLKKTVERLDTDDIQQLIALPTDPRIQGFLLYRLGIAFILDEKYDEALDTLKTFVERFPDNPNHRDASDLIFSLVERSRFIPFTIGCVLPLSGSYATFGQRALNGIELALSQFTKTVGGPSINIIVKDSRSDSGASVRAVDELDQQKVGAILGPMITSENAAERAQAKGIPIFVFTQREGVTDIGTYVFRNFITPQMQVSSLVSYAVKDLGARRFAILYPDENYGRRYMNLFWDQVIEYGGLVSAVEAYDPEGTDFAEPIKKMAGMFYPISRDLTVSGLSRPGSPQLMWTTDADSSFTELINDPLERFSGIPLDRETLDDLGRSNSEREDQWHPIVDFDAVFIPDAPKKAGLIIPQLAYYDIRDVYLLGTNLWNSETLLDMSGEYMQNTLIVDGFFAQSPFDSVALFVADFQSAYGRVPGIIEAVAYDNAMIVIKTMQQTATDSRRELKQAFLQLKDFEGVTGRTGFAPNGEAEKTLQLLRISGGGFVPVRQTSDSVIKSP